MARFSRISLSTVLLSLICFNIFASDTIKITVNTKEKMPLL